MRPARCLVGLHRWSSWTYALPASGLVMRSRTCRRCRATDLELQADPGWLA